MTLSQIRNRVRTLQRKYGLALAVIRVRPYAAQFCNQCANRQCQLPAPPPVPIPSSSVSPTPAFAAPPLSPSTNTSSGSPSTALSHSTGHHHRPLPSRSLHRHHGRSTLQTTATPMTSLPMTPTLGWQGVTCR